eukprot:g31296.t1
MEKFTDTICTVQVLTCAHLAFSIERLVSVMEAHVKCTQHLPDRSDSEINVGGQEKSLEQKSHQREEQNFFKVVMPRKDMA